MHGLPPEDPGRSPDWSRTSEDYARHRPGYPESFYHRLAALGVGLPGQRVLDLGTGTGTVARALAARGCRVTGIDPAPGQVECARRVSREAGIEVELRVAPAEETGLPTASFDVVTASQCWAYFDRDRAVAEVLRLLAPGGLLVTCHLSWLPGCPLVDHTEELVLAANPSWQGARWSGEVPGVPPWLGSELCQVGMFWYDEDLSFTRESWRGRIRACRGLGASLSPEEVARADAALETYLLSRHPPRFPVPHRIDAHILMRRRRPMGERMVLSSPPFLEVST